MQRSVIRHHMVTVTAAALLPLALAGCRNGSAAASPSPPREIVVHAGDYSFHAPDTIPAGLSRIQLLNQGHEPHHLQLARLGEGHTLRELAEHAARGDLTPPWATYVGGPNVPPPGAPNEVTVDLAPGNYAMLCFITSKDGVSHLAKGMLRSLTVVPTSGAGAREPTDGRLVLNDYSFAFTPELRAGRHTIRVENAGAQPHEVFMVRLLPGKTASEALEWAKTRKGPPPFEPAGGTLALSPGAVNFMTTDLVPGEYAALVCFVPDAHDGKPHLAHGMIRVIRVE